MRKMPLPCGTYSRKVLFEKFIALIYLYSLFICGCMKFCSFGVCSCRDSSEVEAEQKLLDEVVLLFYFLPTVK